MKQKHAFLALLAILSCVATALPAVMAAPAAAFSFAPPVHYGLGGRPADLASADLNGDGRPDLVASAGTRGRRPSRHRARSFRAGDADPSGASARGHRPGGPRRQRHAGRRHRERRRHGQRAAGRRQRLLRHQGRVSERSVSERRRRRRSQRRRRPRRGDGGRDDGVSILAGDGTGGLLDPLRLSVGAALLAHRRRATLDLDGSLDLSSRGTSGRTTPASGCCSRTAPAASRRRPSSTPATTLEPRGLAHAG